MWNGSERTKSEKRVKGLLEEVERTFRCWVLKRFCNHEEKVFGTSDSGRDRTLKKNLPHANPEWRERNPTKSRQDEKEKGGVVHTKCDNLMMKRSDS